MTKSELLALVAAGENSRVEFAHDRMRPEQLGKEIAALANLGGGRILLGVSGDGTITGTTRDDCERWLMEEVFERKVYPAIVPSFEEVQLDGRHQVVVVTIGRQTDKPYTVRHDGAETICCRVGSSSRFATREQQFRLFADGGILEPERLPVIGSALDRLNLERLTDYLLRIVGDKTPPNSEEAWVSRLCDLGFMIPREDQSTVCTVAGLVLFGNAPQWQLPQSAVRWMAFDDNDKNFHALDDRTIGGPLVALRRTATDGHSGLIENGLIENVLAVMRPFVSYDPVEGDGSRCHDRHWFYPLAAIREAIMNAIVHRDWTRNEEIEIVQYADRLEIQSPGTLRGTMSLEAMKAGKQTTRNSLIAGVLRDYGYVELKGEGVRQKIIPLLRDNGTEPDFVLTDDYLKVIMPRSSVLPAQN